MHILWITITLKSVKVIYAPTSCPEKKEQHRFVHNFYKSKHTVLILASNIKEVLQNYYYNA